MRDDRGSAASPDRCGVPARYQLPEAWIEAAWRARNVRRFPRDCAFEDSASAGLPETPHAPARVREHREYATYPTLASAPSTRANMPARAAPNARASWPED